MTGTKILAIDTALQAASACVYQDGADAPEASETLAMQRGHAEALLPLIDRVMAQAEGGFAALGRIAVTVGPGSFTGLRVGVAAARALGIACNVPVVGVSTLAALAAPLILAQKPGLVAAAIDAGHGNVYFAAFGSDGRAIVAPRVASVRDAVRLLGTGPIRMAGSGAPLLAIEAWSTHLAAEVVGSIGAPDIAFVARLGFRADPATAPPKPLYLKPPDIKPQEASHVPLAQP
jgi:tRNA threonylcarbamoyladenosine biosynthesis protein TsaB